ncbi:MAG: hypothetical protein ACFE8M_00135 [Candidatus Hermodarchaeota archaeon]
MTEQKFKGINEVKLKTYPKVIFLYPLLITSFILWLIQYFGFRDDPQLWFGNVWMIVFFVNLFIMAFDFSSTKFFLLILAVVIIILLVIFLVPGAIGTASAFMFNMYLTWQFYMVSTVVLAFILALVVISAQFDYWKIERNEIYHKRGVFVSAERIPTKSLRIKKEIPDVFEFFVLRAGSITLMPGHGDVIPLNTVLNVNKKAEQIDWLLSHIQMEPDELDSI